MNHERHEKHEKKRKGLVPKLRFPEFRGKGEWEGKKLGQLGELVSGLTYSPDDIRKEGLLVLRSSNVKNGMITLEDNVYVRPDIKGANPSRPNDILICVRNGSKALIGKNAIIPENMPLCTHGAFMTIFRTESSKFVFQLFQTDAYEKQVAADLGATINSINGNQFKKYVFFVPKPNEQQKIADCLTSLDEHITAEAGKLEAYKVHKKGLMQKLFPADTSTGSVSGETVPEWRFPEFLGSGEWEWEVKSFSELLYVIDGDRGVNYPKTEEYSNSGYCLFLNAKNVTKNGFKFDEMQFITKDKDEDLRKGKLQREDLVLTTRGTVGQFAYFSNIVPYDHIRINSGMVILRIKTKELDSVYLYVYSNSEILSSCIQNVAFGNAQKQLTVAEINKFKLYYPKLPEQQKIADCLSSLDELITAQAQKIDTLKTHKKGLMQGLFPSAEEAR